MREKPLAVKKTTYKLNSHDMTPNSERKHGMHEKKLRSVSSLLQLFFPALANKITKKEND